MTQDKGKNKYHWSHWVFPVFDDEDNCRGLIVSKIPDSKEDNPLFFKHTMDRVIDIESNFYTTPAAKYIEFLNDPSSAPYEVSVPIFCFLKGGLWDH